ncbi:MAG: asparagine--tRNA ligase [Bacteroidales bacterium]|nr:asparagine--tRNA ligase [Bacteroidales bacterium]
MYYISDLHSHIDQEVSLKGWVINSRSSKGIEFIVFRDGTGFLQCIVDENNVGSEVYELSKTLSQESSVEITGKVIKDERQIGGLELHVNNLKIINLTNNYPITNKSHGVQFLMDNRHLWLRSKRQWAIMRVRNSIIYAIHNFFQNEGFMQMDAPLFTGNAAEGSTTLFETEFYDRPAYLSQSGQLYGEAMAMAMGKIYTFGPTFRAEKSKTRRHLSEFWMIEPEMAFYDNEMNMNLIERFIKSVVSEVITRCSSELEVLERDVQFLQKVVETDFPRISYDDAVKVLNGVKEINGITSIDLLNKDLKAITEQIEQVNNDIVEREEILSDETLKQKKRNFIQNKIDILKNDLIDLQEKASHIPEWIKSAQNFKYGEDFGGSDETVLTRMFSLPIMVYNWPKDIKAFYMKRDDENPDLVKGVDVLAPEGFGEIVGGSERETDYDILLGRIREHKLPEDVFKWYLDLRDYGSVPHSGFGLGLERFVSWITNTKHIRETIPFPRMYGRLEP